MIGPTSEIIPAGFPDISHALCHLAHHSHLNLVHQTQSLDRPNHLNHLTLVSNLVRPLDAGRTPDAHSWDLCMCVWGGVREEGRALQAGEGGRGGGGVVGGGVVGGGVGTEGRRSGQVEALYGEAQTEAGGAGKVEALYGEYDLLGCRTTQGGQGVLRAHVCLRMESAVPSLSSNSYRPPSSSPLPSPPLVPQCRALPRLSLCGLHTPCPPSPPPSLPSTHTIISISMPGCSPIILSLSSTR